MLAALQRHLHLSVVIVKVAEHVVIFLPSCAGHVITAAGGDAA
jgi:hypothetical protein